jgi:hypothetical protein
MCLITGGSAAVAGPIRAQGGPPLATDDPGTPGNGHFEVNIALEAERALDGTAYDAPGVDINYGVGDRVQLKLEIPWRIATAPSHPTRTGVGNVILGVKWRFVDRESGRVAISTYPQVALAGFQNTPANAIADTSTGVLLPVQAAWCIGPLNFAAELGYRLIDGASEAAYGLVVAHEALRSLELLGECNGAGEVSFAGVGVLCGFGVRWELGRPISVLGALEAGVAGSEASRPHRRFYAGVQVRW